MQFNIDSIKDVRGARMEIKGSADIQDIDLKRSVVSFKGPVEFSGTVTNAGDCMLVEGSIKGEVEATCDRCLSDFADGLNLEFIQSYCDLAARASQVIFDEEEDMVLDKDEVVIYNGEVIDILPEVEQAIILSIPIRIECRKDCKGLCSGCGVNLNVDECKCEYNN